MLVRGAQLTKANYAAAPASRRHRARPATPTSTAAPGRRAAAAARRSAARQPCRLERHATARLLVPAVSLPTLPLSVCRHDRHRAGRREPLTCKTRRPRPGLEPRHRRPREDQVIEAERPRVAEHDVQLAQRLRPRRERQHASTPRIATPGSHASRRMNGRSTTGTIFSALPMPTAARPASRAPTSPPTPPAR